MNFQKSIKVILSAAVLAACIGSANAQEASKPAENPFTFSGSALGYGAFYQLGKKDNSSDFGAYRFRPYFSYKSENVEATLKFEIDQVFGGGNTGQADVGNDEKGMIEIKAGYLKFMLPFLEGASIKAGADEFKSIGGLVVGTEIGGGFFNYKNDALDLNVAVAQVWEKTITDVKDDTASEKDDATFYAADLTYSMGDIKIRPGLYVINFEKNVSGFTGPVDTTAYIPGIGAGAKFGDISLDLAAQYGAASKDANDIKYSGYAFDANLSYKANDSLKVGAFSTLLSGDDSKTTDKNESFKTFTLKQDGWGRMYLLESKMLFGNIDPPAGSLDVRKNKQGYMLAGAMIEYKLSPITLMAQAAWAQLSEKDANDETALGSEVDASVAYDIQKNAQIVLEGAYLASGKAVETVVSGEKQNAMYVGLGLTTKW